MDIKNIAKKIEILLKLERKVVGIKLVHSEEEFNKYDGIELIRPLSYCVVVKSASLGHSIKLSKKTSGCEGGTRALGLAECPEEFKNGMNGYSLGLYETQEIAKKLADEVCRCNSDTFGVIVKPLENFEVEPDVILIISNTREAMRILQGYTYTYGLVKGMRISGNQAVCVEATVTPLFKKELNISMFCSGTRAKAQWKDSEVISGIPIEKIEGFVNGLIGTINTTENAGRIHEIEMQMQYIN